MRLTRLIVACLAALLLWCGSISAQAQEAPVEATVPRVIQFSGVLRDSAGQPLAGVQGVSFALYREQEGGSPLWIETQNVSADEYGRFAALLGAATSDGVPIEMFSSGESRWLGVAANVPGEPEQPRVLLVSVPYALKAADAETLGGLPASAFLLAANIVTERVKESGGLESLGLTTAAVSDDPITAEVTAGTVGRIGKFINATDLGNSLLFEDTGKIGLGTLIPSDRLHLVETGPGLLRVKIESQSTQQFSTAGFTLRLSEVADANTEWHFYVSKLLGGAATGPASFQIRRRNASQTEALTPFQITASGNVSHVIMQSGFQAGSQQFGNVGIGTQNPTAKLDVAGTVKADAFEGGSMNITGDGGGIVVEDNATSPNIIGGFSDNSVTGSVVGATISGGGQEGSANRVTDDFGTVGGGSNNRAGDSAGTTADRVQATVSGGSNNTASGTRSTVGGGGSNTASATGSTVAGGFTNLASNFRAVVGGGGFNSASGDHATVSGGLGNTASALKATIGGGGRTDDANAATGNRVTDDFGTVGGGGGNQAGNAVSDTLDARYATVGGGRFNTARQEGSTVGGGDSNDAGGIRSTIGGGVTNQANGDFSTVGGGQNNTASGHWGTVPGGQFNTAGENSFAAGRRAKANHAGSFVWADSTNADFTSTGDNQFLIRASGGVGIGKTNPLTELDVNGTVAALAFVGDGSGLTGVGGGGGSFLVAGALNYASGADRFGRLNGDGAQTTIDVANTPVAMAGTLSDMRVRLAVAPAGMESVTVTVFKNSAAQSMTCTIDSPDTTCLINGSTVTFAAGDDFAVKSTGTVSAGTATITWSAVFTP